MAMHSSREAVSTKKGWAHGKGAVQETLARTVTRKKSGVMLWETDPLALLSKSGVGMAEATRTIPWSILALHLRSVCLPNDALHSLKCHPPDLQVVGFTSVCRFDSHTLPPSAILLGVPVSDCCGDCRPIEG